MIKNKYLFRKVVYSKLSSFNKWQSFEYILFVWYKKSVIDLIAEYVMHHIAGVYKEFL